VVIRARARKHTHIIAGIVGLCQVAELLLRFHSESAVGMSSSGNRNSSGITLKSSVRSFLAYDLQHFLDVRTSVCGMNIMSSFAILVVSRGIHQFIHFGGVADFDLVQPALFVGSSLMVSGISDKPSLTSSTLPDTGELTSTRSFDGIQW
jgi:hypothetical protein